MRLVWLHSNSQYNIGKWNIVSKITFLLVLARLSRINEYSSYKNVKNMKNCMWPKNQWGNFGFCCKIYTLNKNKLINNSKIIMQTIINYHIKSKRVLRFQCWTCWIAMRLKWYASCWRIFWVVSIEICGGEL